MEQVLFAGDPVTFIAEKPPDNFPTRWIAKQVLINDQTAAIVTKAVDRGPYKASSSSDNATEVESNA